MTKIPRFAFEKFPARRYTLTTSMKSVGEVMAIGRTFEESLQKALRSSKPASPGSTIIVLEGLGQGDDKRAIRAALGTPTPDRISKVAPGAAARLDHERDLRLLPHRPVVRLAAAEHRRCRSRRSARMACPDTARTSAGSKAMGFSDARLAQAYRPHRSRSGTKRRASACARSISASTPAPRNSRRPRPICTRLTKAAAAARSNCEAESDATAKRSSSWAAAPTASARASSSTIAAATPPSRCRRPATRPSWSTATRRRSRPTTTPPTGSTSSR